MSQRVYATYTIIPEAYGYNSTKMQAERDSMVYLDPFFSNVKDNLLFYDVGRAEVWNGHAESLHIVERKIDPEVDFFILFEKVGYPFAFHPTIGGFLEMCLWMGYTVVVFNHEGWFNFVQYEEKRTPYSYEQKEIPNEGYAG
jgi:hypothetical protein